MDVARETVMSSSSPFQGDSLWKPIPRKLNFSPVPSDTDFTQSDVSPLRNSPPCRPLRILRLSEKPLTPNTICLNSTRKNNGFLNVLSGRLSAPNLNPFTPQGLARTRKRCRSRSELQSHDK